MALMKTVSITGPKGSHIWQAAKQFAPDCTTIRFTHVDKAAEAFSKKETDYLILPVYNTRIGGILKSFQVMEKLNGFWVDNIVLPIHLSLASLDDTHNLALILGTRNVLRQCEDYLTRKHPEISLLAVPDLEEAIAEMKTEGFTDRGAIEAESLLREQGLIIREREVLPHNRTRFGILSHQAAKRTGYDATSLITRPLKDRVGMLFDTLGEFTRRGVNLLDMKVEADSRTQKLQIYLEAEGHVDDQGIQDTLRSLERKIIQEPKSIKILGSYPRVDMRVKHIKKFGFIGTGEMSKWFAGKLENEGYETLLTGRSTSLRPEKMIASVDVVIICVPISKTSETIKKYGSFLKDGQALILLAGEADNTLNTAKQCCSQGVELMLVHNLWGPAAAGMRDKNASIVRTARSGPLCSEFEAFLYKHGAEICHDSPQQHDLLMGVNQKLPTTVSVALAMALAQHKINTDEIDNHATLTSLYGILAMARIHSQNPRTYAEIMATGGEGRKIVRSFAENMVKLMELAEAGDIDGLCQAIEKSRRYLGDDFLKTTMERTLAVDQTLSGMLKS
jgi:prephenate dehydratase/prephenate dehydrogenase